MDLNEMVADLNERLSQSHVPMDELRVRVGNGQLVLVGTRALNYPTGRKTVHVREPDRNEPASAAFEPDEGRRHVEEFLATWPHV